MADAPPPAPVPIAPPRRFRHWRRILAALTGLGLFAGGFWYFYIRDELPPDDADLRPTGRDVPDEENGERVFESDVKGGFDFGAYAAANGVEGYEASQILFANASNNALVAGYLDHIQPELVQVETALNKPYFEFYRPEDNLDTLRSLSLFLNCGRTLMLAARFAQAQGDFATVGKEIALAEKLARRIADGHGSIIQVLTAMTIDGMAHEMAVDALNDPQIPLIAITFLQQAFRPEIAWVPACQNAYRREYQFFRSRLEKLQRDSTSLDRLMSSNPREPSLLTRNIKSNQTLRLLADTSRITIAAAELDYADLAQQYPALLAPAEPGPMSSWEILLPNGGGRRMQALAMEGGRGILATKFTFLAADRLVLIALAIRHYYADHHALPAKLSDLAPQYLPAVPIDPFDNQPLLYDATHGLIYSVGTSLKDNGGSKFLHQSKADPDYQYPLFDEEQPTLQLEFQTPPPASGSTNAAK